jgi:hypothetical protein
METMTPKEKALRLMEKFENALTIKDCAKVTINEICEAINWHEFEVPNEEFNYWNEVKDEINKL